MKKRIYFDKEGDMKYISHLDTIRFLERLFKKANIKVKFSEGFHPRPKMSFGNPVSLGVEAYNEVMDLELAVEMDNEELLSKMNEFCPDGITFKSIEDVPRKASITEDFEIMKYEITGEPEFIQKIVDVLNQDEIIEERIKKRKLQRRNLKEKLVSYKVDGNVLYLEVKNSSPNAFLGMAGVGLGDVKLKKTGYVLAESAKDEK